MEYRNWVDEVDNNLSKLLYFCAGALIGLGISYVINNYIGV